MEKFLDILESLTHHEEEFHNPLDYEHKDETSAKAAEDLVNTGLIAMLVLMIVRNTSKDERIACIEMLKTKMRTKYVREYERFSKEQKVQDILNPHREDIIVEINDRVEAACTRLRNLLQVA